MCCYSKNGYRLEPKCRHCGSSNCEVCWNRLDCVPFAHFFSTFLDTREKDGLAMSSRNAYLSVEEREKATILYRMLQKAKELYTAGNVYPNIINPFNTVAIGMLDVNRIKEELENLAAQVDGFHLHYVSICNPKTFKEYENQIPSCNTLVCVAGTLGKARLIDNILLN